VKIQDVLRSLGVRPSKERGQNFLTDSSVPQAIIDQAALRPDDHIVEIGPGLGALTRTFPSQFPLTLIEIEDAFCEYLAKNFPHAEILHEDVREVDWSTFPQPLVVFGNLPYSLSTEIIFSILASYQHMRKAIFLLQKEFVQRMGAQPGSRTYGSLSVATQLRADVRFGPIVPGNAFFPKAGVDSQVVELRFSGKLKYPLNDLYWFERLLRASFHQRRRKILNSLQSSKIFTHLDLPKILETAHIAIDTRAEMLTVEEYVRLANLIHLSST
jgi:16S rRNA (adenine1518-N6/adenine1519-N6)-dimethyltransferase